MEDSSYSSYADEQNKNKNSTNKNSVNKNRLLFPIPQTEMDANILMTQNPGY